MVALQEEQDRKDCAPKFFEIHRRRLGSLQPNNSTDILVRLRSLYLVRELFMSDTYVPISSEHSDANFASQKVHAITMGAGESGNRGLAA